VPARARRALRASPHHAAWWRSRTQSAQGLDPSSMRSPRFHLRGLYAPQCFLLARSWRGCYNVTSSCGDNVLVGRGGWRWRASDCSPSLGHLQFASAAGAMCRAVASDIDSPGVVFGIVPLIAAVWQAIRGSTVGSKTSKVERALRWNDPATRGAGSSTAGFVTAARFGLSSTAFAVRQRSRLPTVACIP
jgi:hypothetical protein